MCSSFNFIGHTMREAGPGRLLAPWGFTFLPMCLECLVRSASTVSCVRCRDWLLIVSGDISGPGLAGSGYSDRSAPGVCFLLMVNRTDASRGLYLQGAEQSWLVGWLVGWSVDLTRRLGGRSAGRSGRVVGQLVSWTVSTTRHFFSQRRVFIQRR